MDKQLAKEKLEKLISKGKFEEINHIFDFLVTCVPVGELEELLAFAAEKKKVHLDAKEVMEKQQIMEEEEALELIRNTSFTWDEMMSILEEVGGVLTFNVESKNTKFSRYNRFGHLVTTIDETYFRPLDIFTEERIAPYKLLTYKINREFSGWREQEIAAFLKTLQSAN